MKKIKMVTSLTLVLLLVLTSMPAEKALATTNEIKVMVNGVKLTFDQPPIIQGGRVMLPLRTVFESLGAVVHWNNSTQTVTGLKGKTTIELKIGSNRANVNGKEKELDVPPKKINNRTLIPLRFVAESLGAEVKWDKDTKTAIITDLKKSTYEDGSLKNAEVISVKFFDSDNGKATKSDKQYYESFSKREAKYIHCEVNFLHSIPGKKLEVPFRVVYYTQDNKVLTEINLIHVIEASHSTSSFQVSWGHDEVEKWLMGPYFVKVYDEHTEIASGKFLISN